MEAILIKSYEVRQVLQISKHLLAKLRQQGKLRPVTTIGKGFYLRDEVVKLGAALKENPQA